MPFGPIILPIITAYNPDWLPKFNTDSPSLTKCPIKLILPGYHVPELSITAETNTSFESTYKLKPYKVRTSF